MPSPIGHALAGLAVAWSARVDRSESSGRSLALACIAIAVLPDADLLYPPVHRSITHSVGATILVFIIAAAVTGWVTGRISWAIASVCAAAHGSHILLDWLGTDRVFAPFGLQMFWPFDRGWYVSGWDLFPGTERRQLISPAAIATNVRAIAWEIALLGPIVFLLRRKARGAK